MLLTADGTNDDGKPETGVSPELREGFLDETELDLGRGELSAA